MWEPVTDEIDGRREIIGWARKGMMRVWDDIEVEEWLAICMKRKTGGVPITVACDCSGWLPSVPAEIVLEDAPRLDVRVRKMFEDPDRVKREICEAAQRYRDEQSARA